MMPSADDWLPAFDDGIVGRLHHCTACGGPFHEATYDILPLDETLAVAIVMCPRCLGDDPTLEALAGLLRRRYSAFV